MRCPLIVTLLTLLPLAAAELPITSITVLPDGLLVEHTGTLPAGDRLLSGLPQTCAVDGIAFIGEDGREVAWRLVTPPPAVVRVADDAALKELANSQRAAAHAGNRSALAAMINEVSEDPASGPLPPLATPESLAAQLAFAQKNAERATTAAQAAAEQAAAARARLAAAMPLASLVGPQLELAAVTSGPLSLRYRLPGATWQPTWRIELDASGAQLVQLAEIHLDDCPTKLPIALTVTTYGQQPPVLLPEPRIMLFGLNESMALEHAADPLVRAEKIRASKGGESAVEASLRQQQRLQSADGSWGSTPATTALSLVVFTGAGYDHKVPNLYRETVRNGLAWVQAQDPQRLDLPSLALTTLALGEAYAMTADPQIKPAVEHFLAALRRRAPGELPGWCAREGALAGPEVALLVCMALKSTLAAGLDIGGSLHEVHAAGSDGEELRLAQAVIDVFTGLNAGISLEEAQAWAAAAPRWLATGRCELLYMAMMAGFQQGGPVWPVISGSIRPLLASHVDPDGLVSTPYPLGRLAGSLWCALSMETYYRYRQVQVRQDEPTSPPPLASRWPMRLRAAQPVSLVSGTQEVELRRIRLQGKLRREAVPALNPAVWRVLETTNPWPSSLPPGPLTIVVEGRIVGHTVLPETAPGGELRLALGADDRYRIRREVTTATEDGLLSRTLTVTVTCSVEAPAGANDAVMIREGLPEPGAEAVSVGLLAPLALNGEAYREHLKKQPQASVLLTANGPTASAIAWRANFTYSRSLRPRLETR